MQRSIPVERRCFFNLINQAEHPLLLFRSYSMEPANSPDSKEEKPSPDLLARNLKLLRKMKGISQQQLAKALGLKRNNIASYESGIVEPGPHRFLALARFFRIDPVALFTTDLTEHPVDKLSDEETRLQDELPAGELDAFITKTMDLQKVIEGFREFYKVKKQHQASDDPTLSSLNNDFENLLEILKKLLDANWDLIHSLKE
jgi:transcriptional regulator with XRE-family HTH domain